MTLPLVWSLRLLWTALVICRCIRSVDGQEQVATAVPPRTEDYPTRVPGSCGNTNSFDCFNGKCVPFTAVRNCIDDCGNGADETCGANLALCDTRILAGGCGKCVVNGTQERNCVDSLYISLCTRDPSTVAKCQSTPNCVLTSWVNDGKNDCGDGSDEDPCFTSTSRCSPDADCNYDSSTARASCICRTGFTGDGFTCTSSGGVTGGVPVGNRTDVLGRIPGDCAASPLQFDCGNGLCLPIVKFRDCHSDCPDGVDEACWVGQIRCDGCKCVDPQDQDTECTSSQNCIANGQFACVGGGCIFDAMVLDGTADCTDGSDENYCKTFLTCPQGSQCVYNVLIHNFTCNCPPPLQVNSRGVCESNASSGSSKDCADVMTVTRTTKSGVQTVTIPGCSSGSCTKQVYCDLETEGGGWTVIQRRLDGAVDFFRNWTEYKNGFGSLTGEQWLGNEYVSQLTNRGLVYELYILMATTQNQVVPARYDLFRVGPESDSYRLKLGNFILGDNDNLQPSRDAPFGTMDKDTDVLSNVICGVWWMSGWWFQPSCGSSGNLNVPYNPVPQYGNLAGILWPGTARSARMKSTLMMIRPLGFTFGGVTSPRYQNQRLAGCVTKSSIYVITLASFVALLKRR